MAGSLNFKIKFGKNSGLVMSPAELLERYFFGISICTANGERLSNETILQKLRAAQSKLENYLQVKFQKQIQEEQKDFIRAEFQGWGFAKMQFPVRSVVVLEGFINSISQILYPSDWVSTNKPSDEKLLSRHIHIIPSGSDTALSNSVVYSGITPHLGFFGQSHIPNYWRCEYCTGFDNVPDDIADVIGKIASQQLFAILGDILLGAGIASQSVGFDGLTQSIATTQSAENSAFSARVRQYENELKKELPALREYYKGISWTVA